MKRLNTTKSAAAGLANPYLNARRTWNEHVGSVITARQTWQVIGILSLLIALAAMGGIMYIGSQSKFIPYVVEVDKLGQTVGHGALNASTSLDNRLIRATVVDFIQDARSVTADAALQKKAILRLYARLQNSDPATAKLTEWLNGNPETNPFKRAEKELVHAEIRTVIPQTPDTWQIEWNEVTRDRKGNRQGEVVWRALVTVYRQESTAQTTEEQLHANPLGLYVRDFTWTKVQ